MLKMQRLAKKYHAVIEIWQISRREERRCDAKC
jgi:hypothetical protein